MLSTLCVKLYVVAIIASLKYSNAVATTQQCQEWGFTGEGSCTDCDTLDEFVRVSSLAEECRQCCIKDKTIMYQSAVLEVCPHRLSLVPEIADFLKHLEKSSELSKKVQVRMKVNVMPRLKLKIQGGGSETIQVEGWRKQVLIDFLTDRVTVAKAQLQQVHRYDRMMGLDSMILLADVRHTKSRKEQIRSLATGYAGSDGY